MKCFTRRSFFVFQIEAFELVLLLDACSIDLQEAKEIQTLAPISRFLSVLNNDAHST